MEKMKVIMVGCDYDPQQLHSFQFAEINLEIVNNSYILAL